MLCSSIAKINGCCETATVSTLPLFSCNMLAAFIALSGLCAIVLAGPPQDRPWMDTGLTPAQRAAQLLAQMNFTEKVRCFCQRAASELQ